MGNTGLEGLHKPELYVIYNRWMGDAGKATPTVQYHLNTPRTVPTCMVCMDDVKAGFWRFFVRSYRQTGFTLLFITTDQMSVLSHSSWATVLQ